MLGTLTMAGLLVVSGQVPADIWCTNQRSLKIPIDILPAQRQQIRQLLLYVSPDQGKTWTLAGKVTPDEPAFRYDALADGIYWFRVAAIDLQGKQQPEHINRGPPDQKTLIDTIKPMIRLHGQRQGEEITASWEIEEAYPVPESLKLEYHATDTPASQWSDVPIKAGPTGQARFQLKTSADVELRMQLKDRADNMSQAFVKVTASGVAPSSYNPPGTDEKPPPPVAPPSDTQPKQLDTPHETMVIPPAQLKKDGPALLQPDSGSKPAPLVSPPSIIQEKPLIPPATNTIGNEPRVAASTQTTQAAPAIAGYPAPTPISGRRMPQAQLVNDREVTLEYQLDRVGPSGVGSVELFLTRDEGQTWIRFAKDDEPEKGALPGGKYQRTLDLPGEGVFGLILVVKSRAGMGKAPPRPGDLPEMVIEVDTTPPIAQLFVPQADPQQRDGLILSWSAKDRNLAAKPITLEWSERRDGPWLAIDTDLPNIGRYSWQMPKGIPVSVYLRLRVRDSAGNEGIAVTSEPQLIDLSEPEGRLISVRPSVRRQ